jgi:hypothetical protein
MSEKELSKKVLESIEEKQIKPKARWAFLLKEYLLWGLAFATMIVGALAFSIIFAQLFNNDWDLYRRISGSLPGFIIMSLPYVWIILLALFLLLGNYQIRHTKHAYKYPVYSITLLLVGLSSLLGILFYNIGYGKAVNEHLSRRSELYRRFADPRQQRWGNPEQGMLAGRVEEGVSGASFILIDPKMKEWEVRLPDEPLFREYIPKIGERVRVLGEVEEPFIFAAKQVLPWDLQKSPLKKREDLSETKQNSVRIR